MKEKVKNKLSNKKQPDIGLNCEYFFREELPYLLNLSNSKKAAMRGKFYQFATYVRHLHDRAPIEFENFFKEVEKRIYEVSKYRRHKNLAIGSILYRNPHTRTEYYNGKLRIILVEKTKKRG